MRTKTALVLVALALAAGGCGDSKDSADGGSQGPDLGSGVANLNTAVPACPFDAAKASEIVGQPLEDEGDCLFSDGKGVASLTITVSSELAGSSTYEYKRKQAGETFDKVVDVEQGKYYIAVEDLKGEAMRISKKGSFTLIMSSFGFDPAKYEQTLRALLDAIPA